MKTQQQSLFDKQTKRRYNRTAHGGKPIEGSRKLERPLSRKAWHHTILKSDKAVGKLSFLAPKNKAVVERILYNKAKKFGVVIGDLANVGNHLHLKVKITSRELFQKFLISVTALIARAVTGAKKGKPFGRFWLYLAYTRVLKSFTEELNLSAYFIANRAEATRGEAVRERMLKALNKWIYKDSGWLSG